MLGKCSVGKESGLLFESTFLLPEARVYIDDRKLESYKEELKAEL